MDAPLRPDARYPSTHAPELAFTPRLAHENACTMCERTDSLEVRLGSNSPEQVRPLPRGGHLDGHVDGRVQDVGDGAGRL